MAQGKYFFTSHAQHTTAILASLDVIFSVILSMSIICLEGFADYMTEEIKTSAAADFFNQVSRASGGTGLGHGFLVINLAVNIALLFGVRKPFRFFMLPWMILKAIAAIPYPIGFIAVMVFLPTATCKIFGGGAILLGFSLHLYQLVIVGNAFSELRPSNMQQRQDIMI